MNSLIILAALVQAPAMAIIVFWLLIILCAIGSVGFSGNPVVVRTNTVVILILFAILGYYVFGF